ncbi:MAG: polyether ionophore transport system permease protein, partial [Actinomycetota bacterium]|nr:polyether ionophore transport system permease protein [Actinomycetota bacterium]
MGASVVLGGCVALGLGLVGLPWSGACAFGLGWAASGIVFTAIGAVAAQVTTSARAAVGLGMTAVGVAYALRAMGDLAQGDPGLLSWLSPIGWSQQFRPFAGDRWWVAVLPLLATAVLVPLAFALRSRRDLGSGLIPERPGPPVGRIDGAPGLAWRLQRGLLLAWLAGAAVMGLALGSIAHNVQGLLDSEQMRGYLELLGGEQALTDAFLAAEMALMGAIVAAYGVAATSRLRHEEAAGHAELILATATGRVAWAASHFGLALGGVAAVLLVAGSAVGFSHGTTIADPLGQTLRMAGAALAQVPAAWVVAAAVLVLFGWLPRALAAAWGLLVAFIVFGEFGALWELPDWVLDLSPFRHSPRLPGAADVGAIAGSLTGLVLVTVVLAAVGFVGWRRRDLHP